MVPAGRQGYPRATLGTLKGDRVGDNRTTGPEWKPTGGCDIANQPEE